jgi:hypothetical protein
LQTLCEQIEGALAMADGDMLGARDGAIVAVETE